MKLRCSDNCPESQESPIFKVIALVDEDGDLATPEIDTSEARCAHCDAEAEEE